MAKYVVRARIDVDGEVEKSDIIGAIFGFTEGLFGEEFDLRDLQDKGRIGRISVEIKTEKGKTTGEILIPSNLDRIETALLAALIENVEKVGPYQAKIQVIDIVDVRAEKLKKIMDRASEIAKKYFVEKAPDIKEILNKIGEAVRIAEIIYYGPEKLPAGPDIESSDTIIIVEGRADVLNLLRYGYRNVIALEGAHGSKVPETIVKLASKKTAILFVDGDRAGELIAREVIKVADIDFVTRAPPGKEVEELTGKEIAKALKNLVPAKQFLESLEKRIEAEAKQQIQATGTAAPQPQPPQEIPSQQIPTVSQATPATAATQVVEAKQVVTPPVVEVKPVAGFEMPLKIVEEGKKLIGTLEAILFDAGWNIVERVPVRDLVEKLQQVEPGKIQAIVFDGVITQRLLDVASEKGVKLILGVRIGNISRKPENIFVVTFQDIFSITS
ncbi:DNA primase DnaG [Ignisphaera sp. 4213-co]|uniref:DNA primase DnaG n=1 Tax=Ignisphaera cupida TaxID=3050454 RepID=A0ABD4Z681_9CREN|nr:DNA primase DnaG [Ignisphaera sp. 4213-co]MDK6028724.1 DNA primase DnaG [Ignisphaera sp. 4213-co]